MGLSVLAPGLGLARTGPIGPALTLLAGGPAATFGVAALFAILPTMGPLGWSALMLALFALWIVIWLSSLVLTWRESRFRRARERWNRWYAIAALYAATTIATGVAVNATKSSYRLWHVAGQAMLPELEIGTVFVVKVRHRSPLRVGDIAVVAGPGGTEYVTRIVARNGSVVAIRHGAPVVDGRPAVQRPVATRMLTQYGASVPAHILAERLAGDTRSHRVMDLEADGPLDDMSPRLVPAGHVYVLGDNRDHSADSRLPRRDLGLGMVPVADVRGRALFALWTADHGVLGTDLTR